MSTSTDAPTTTPALRLTGIEKHFGGVTALDGVDLDLHRGQIVGLVGDNGAGKSTLVKIIAGVHQPSAGSIELDGQPTTLPTPNAAREAGIEVVYQDLALVDEQPVYMNMFLGREGTTGLLRRLDHRHMQKQTAEILHDLDVRVPSAKATIRDLSGGQRQGVAIGRATHWAQHLVLMDEPTAALGVQETKTVESTILRLRERGLAVLVVSHNLDQVFRLADRICVLRRGTQVGVVDADQVTADDLVAMITGLR